jgi:CheY-like chemotaxis protein
MPAKKQGHPIPHILVVDDDETIRKLFSRVLVRCGYHVDTAIDGEAGWAALQAASYDLLITDNSMPKVSGVELIRLLRSASMTFPVIMVTATPPAEAELPPEAEILLKPVSPAKLVQRVIVLLHGEMPVGEVPDLKKLARRLLFYEEALCKPADADKSAAFRVFEKLRGPLVRMVGVNGYRSLVARARALAAAEAPWLLALPLPVDGSLAGIDELESRVSRRAVAEGEVLMVARLLGLLVVLIGSALTRQLFHESWPAMEDLAF